MAIIYQRVCIYNSVKFSNDLTAVHRGSRHDQCLVRERFFLFLLNLTTPTRRAMSRDEDKYPDAEKFRPERHFTPDGSLIAGSILNDPLFGFGRRICEAFLNERQGTKLLTKDRSRTVCCRVNVVGCHCFYPCNFSYTEGERARWPRN